MLELKPLEPDDINNVGTHGWVEFQLFGYKEHPEKSFGTRILCEVVGIAKGQYEICAVSGDRSCLWIDSDKIYRKVHR